MTHASVFSGIGGPEVAASMLGWENLFHCEINPFGRKVLDYWYPNAKSYEDITTTDFTELQQAKVVCLKDITEALPRYTERLAAIDQRLTEYVEVLSPPTNGGRL